MKDYILIAYVIYLVIISLVTFFCYGVDKSQAKRGGFRTPEKVLLTLSIFGGAFGGIMAMKRFRHKTKHGMFIFVNALGVIIHAALIMYIAFFLNV